MQSKQNNNFLVHFTHTHIGANYPTVTGINQLNNWENIYSHFRKRQKNWHLFESIHPYFMTNRTVFFLYWKLDFIISIGECASNSEFLCFWRIDGNRVYCKILSPFLSNFILFFLYKFLQKKIPFINFFSFLRKCSLEITFWDWCHKSPLCVLASKLSFSLLCGTLIEKSDAQSIFFTFSQHFYVIELSLSEILLLCVLIICTMTSSDSVQQAFTYKIFEFASTSYEIRGREKRFKSLSFSLFTKI